MEKTKGLLDLPNEILRDHILSQIEQDDLFWKVGMVCKRLLHIVFDMNKSIIVSKKEIFRRSKSLQRRQSQSRPSYLMKFHKDAYNEQEELNLQAQLKTVFSWKEVSQCVKSFSNIHMQPYFLQTRWEEQMARNSNQINGGDESLKGVSVSYRAGYTPMNVFSDILVNSDADLDELFLNFSQVMECN